MSYREAYENRPPVRIIVREVDEDVVLTFEEINFNPYNNPDVSIESASRFAVHNVIGGETVRQRVGEAPTEIRVKGVCTEDIVSDVIDLRKVNIVQLFTNEISTICQVASCSVDPLKSGGAVDMDGGQFLYEYTINFVEIGAGPNQLPSSTLSNAELQTALENL